MGLVRWLSREMKAFLLLHVTPAFSRTEPQSQKSHQGRKSSFTCRRVSKCSVLWQPEFALVGLLRQRPRSVAFVLLSFALATEAAASSPFSRPHSRFEHCPSGPDTTARVAMSIAGVASKTASAPNDRPAILLRTRKNVSPLSSAASRQSKSPRPSPGAFPFVPF